MLNFFLDLNSFQMFFMLFLCCLIVIFLLSKIINATAIACLLISVVPISVIISSSFQASMNEIYATKLIQGLKNEKEVEIFKERYGNFAIFSNQNMGFYLCEKSNYASQTCLNYLSYFEAKVKKYFEQERKKEALELLKKQEIKKNIEKLKTEV